MARKGSGTRRQRRCGSRRRQGSGHSLKGGFYPSVMSGVVGAGSLLSLASLRQGYRLLENDKERMFNRLRPSTRKAKPGSRRYQAKRT